MLLHHDARYPLCKLWCIVHPFRVWNTSPSWVYYHLCLQASSRSNNGYIALLKRREFVWRVALLLQWWLSAAIWSRVLCSSLPRGSQGLNKSWFPWYFSPTGDFLSQPGTDDLWCAPEGDVQSKLATFCLYDWHRNSITCYATERVAERQACVWDRGRRGHFSLNWVHGWAGIRISLLSRMHFFSQLIRLNLKMDSRI